MLERNLRVGVAIGLAVWSLACASPSPTQVGDEPEQGAPSILFVDSLRHREDFENGWGAMRFDTSYIAKGEYDFRIRDATGIPGVVRRCAWMQMDNANASSKVWLYAELRGRPNRAYRVEVTMSAGPSRDFEGLPPSLIGAISTAPPLPPPKGTDFDRQSLLLTPQGGTRGEWSLCDGRISDNGSRWSDLGRRWLYASH
jgi:hypothetical protein